MTRRLILTVVLLLGLSVLSLADTRGMLATIEREPKVTGVVPCKLG